MKIILSRKGFDSAAGGVASPVLPDGTMVSLPIPDRQSPIRYSDVCVHGHPLGEIVEDLTGGRMKAHFGAHLDPDLAFPAVPRQRGWRPIFGQAGGEQTVLAREGVGPGDLFLFFGWFRQVGRDGATLRYQRGAADLHVIWGWMQVASVHDVASGALPSWANYHPHVAAPIGRTNNTIYVASDRLSLGHEPVDLPGAGVLRTYSDRLRLTKPGATRSVWSLPGWFEPSGGRPALGYHGTASRWARDGDRVALKSVGRGQEFVFDTGLYPEATAWVEGLLGRGA